MQKYLNIVHGEDLLCFQIMFNLGKVLGSYGNTLESKCFFKIIQFLKVMVR